MEAVLEGFKQTSTTISKIKWKLVEKWECMYEVKEGRIESSTRDKNFVLRRKRRRMRWVLGNGTVLISWGIFLSFHRGAHFVAFVWVENWVCGIWRQKLNQGFLLISAGNQKPNTDAAATTFHNCFIELFWLAYFTTNFHDNLSS